ncbi:MAG: cadmium-translocating P-type ATPase [Candidatus Cloacimonetes bacterium HGW-Cloacimonetes-3]|jgi:Cd2+/Zn2+-exporting ATPase|nr:MAG: cadmium-translocating P-type ATPase [Candidatus Cloacimonetes bacterium HGW-Cloacimonetes-3]
MIIEEYDIKNLDCAGCSAKIESEIGKLQEVSTVHLDFINKRLVVQYNDKVEMPLDRLNAIAGKIEPGVLLTYKGSEEESSEKKPWFVVLSVVLLGISLFLHGIPSVVMGLLAYAIVSHRVIRTAIKELFSRQLFAEHFLMTIATIGALYLGEYTEAAAVMILFEAGQYLEGRAVNRSRGMVKAMLSLKPEFAHLNTPKGIQEVRLAQVKKGANILVYPGERIPLDGQVLKGESTVDTSSLTGEAEPVLVIPGSLVYAGFMNSNAGLEIEVSSNEAESMISRILGLIENASAKKSTTEKFITRFARYYTPAVVGAASLVYLIPLLLGFPGEVWFKRALVFLIVSCPCALVISIPLSYYIGIGLAAKRGIIFKGSTYLDVLRNVHTLVFDKTGTLTTGELKVSNVLSADGIKKEELSSVLYTCEYTSSHPFANAVKASFTGSFHPADLQATSEFPGKGVLLQYNGDRLIAGSEAFLRSYGFLSFMDSGSQSAVHAARNDTYLGCVTFDDAIKPRMKENLALLRHYGIKHLSMLSGDRPQKAEQVANELGLDSFYAGLLPEQKMEKLEEIIASAKGKVAYCGDGLNDAPVLARADVGIAMGKIGAQASIESADVVLLNDRPEQLVSAFVLSQKTNRLVWQNICLALGVKVLVMSTGLAGVSGLWEAIIADVGVTLLVIFHSLRMMNKHDKLDK